MKKAQVLLSCLATLAVLAVAIQWVPVPRDNPPVLSDLNAPAAVRTILRTSCYDCHSNETVWPWYSRVAPVSWLVAMDVKRGRRHFNFSTWSSYSPRRQSGIIAHTIREVRRGAMPPWYYTIKHQDAKLSPDQRTVLEAWAAQQPKP